jgi:tetratricopeptide (TPR) repeat protein
VVEALTEECAAWLSAGHSPETLRNALYLVHTGWRRQIKVSTIDLNGDGLTDVVVEPQVPRVPVLACLAQEEEDYVCQPIPNLAIPGPTMDISHSESLLVRDLTDDGRPETIVTYYDPGASGWTELLYIFNWVDGTSPDVVFRAALVNWAGQSTWQFESDPAAPGRQQVVLTYSHLYAHGFDHKMVNHPIGRQVWRWDENAERFVPVEKSVDTSQSTYGAQMPATLADQLRWLTNEGETAFRAGLYEEALSAYDEALARAQAEGWTPAADEPDWVGLLRFRRGETLAHLGRTSAAVAALKDVASDYEEDLLGELAEAFLTAYGDGSATDAVEKGCAALQELGDRVEDHFYYERKGALRFPMTATGIPICEPDPDAVTSADETLWPCVGAFGCPPAW